MILILEAGSNRIQALDLGASPARHFTKQSGPNTSPYSLTLGTDPVQAGNTSTSRSNTPAT